MDRRIPSSHENEAPLPVPDPRLPRSVVLVGLMGAGKTSIGRMLAERLGLRFLDADSEIEAAAGCTIEEIFEYEGEAAFRAGERRVIARLLKGPPSVIATGGGAFMDPDTRARIREAGISIWLRADLETLVRRVGRRGGRPLLKSQDARQVLTHLMEERSPVYGEANIVIETSDAAPEKVTNEVIQALEAHFGTGSLTAPGKRTHGRNGARRRARRSGHSRRHLKVSAKKQEE